MARVNITVPDDLIAEARAAGLNVSRLASGCPGRRARPAKVAAIDQYLAELEAELGPVGAKQRATAEASVDVLEAALASPEPVLAVTRSA